MNQTDGPYGKMVRYTGLLTLYLGAAFLSIAAIDLSDNNGSTSPLALFALYAFVLTPAALINLAVGLCFVALDRCRWRDLAPTLAFILLSSLPAIFAIVR